MLYACVAARCDQARDLSTVSQNALKLWMTVDARVDVDGARVAQWNDISHGENHAKQNNAGKPMLSCFFFSQSVRPPRMWSYCARTCRQEPCVREHARRG